MLFANQHPRPDPRRDSCKRSAPLARRHDVRAEVAEAAQTPVITAGGGELAGATARDVLKKHALDGVRGTEGEDLILRRLDEVSGHVTQNSRGHWR